MGVDVAAEVADGAQQREAPGPAPLGRVDDLVLHGAAEQHPGAAGVDEALGREGRQRVLADPCRPRRCAAAHDGELTLGVDVEVGRASGTCSRSRWSRERFSQASASRTKRLTGAQLDVHGDGDRLGGGRAGAVRVAAGSAGGSATHLRARAERAALEHPRLDAVGGVDHAVAGGGTVVVAVAGVAAVDEGADAVEHGAVGRGDGAGAVVERRRRARGRWQDVPSTAMPASTPTAVAASVWPRPGRSSARGGDQADQPRASTPRRRQAVGGARRR